MELDLEIHHQESQAPVSALSTVADSLPGLGIVAAVLGVVITMGVLGGPPEAIGHKVAAALVGPSSAYCFVNGFIGPMAAFMAKQNEETEANYLRFLRSASILLFAETPLSSPSNMHGDRSSPTSGRSSRKRRAHCPTRPPQPRTNLLKKWQRKEYSVPICARTHHHR